MALRASTRAFVALVLAMLAAAAAARAWWPVHAGDLPSQRTGERVDLNAADAPTMGLLPGIAPNLAERIVEHRSRHGPFRRVEDLSQVRGIGSRTVERIRPWVTVSAPEEPAADAAGTAADHVSGAPSPATAP